MTTDALREIDPLGEIEIDDDPQAVLAEFCKRQWCDGLPIVAPTAARVGAMLAGADGTRVIGAMPPLWRQATVEKLAVNAVMAGCEAAYFPLIVAAVEARRFSLVALMHPLDTPVNGTRWTPAVRAALQAAYAPEAV